MKRFFTSLAIMAAMVLSLTGIETKAQTVTNINVEVYGNKVIVNYNLDKTTDIDLYVSVDGGTTWEGPLKQVSGNIGKNVQPGSNSIIWDAIKERGGISGDDIVFDIRLPKTTTNSTSYTLNDNDLINIKKSTKTGDKYVIEYSLDERASAIGLFYSEDNGATWKQAKYIEGDFYNVWPSEKRQIAWDFSKETDLGTTPAFKLKIMQKESIDKAYRKNLEKRSFAEKNSTAYYYDNGKLLRKFYGGWFVQPEIGVGLCNYCEPMGLCNYCEPSSYYYHNFYTRLCEIITVNCLFGYQIVRPFGIGLKIGYMRDIDGNGENSMPVTLNMKGFLGKGRNSIYYNIGFGYLANLKGYTEVEDYQYYYDYPYSTSCRNIIFETERSGLLLSAEIGLAIRNFNIGIEYNFTKIHCSLSFDRYIRENDVEVFDRHVSVSENYIDHVFLLKLGYNIPLKKR